MKVASVTGAINSLKSKAPSAVASLKSKAPSAVDVKSSIGSVSRAATRLTEGEGQLERNVRVATNNKDTGCPNTVLYEIAQASNSLASREIIMEKVWARLKECERNPAKWRGAFKTLCMLEFIIKYGSIRIADEVRREQLKVQPFMDFKMALQAGNLTDRSAVVRSKATQVVMLVTDKDFLVQERTKARQNLSRLEGVAADAQMICNTSRPGSERCSESSNSHHNSESREVMLSTMQNQNQGLGQVEVHVQSEATTHSSQAGEISLMDLSPLIDLTESRTEEVSEFSLAAWPNDDWGQFQSASS
jgi:epsin